MKPYLIFTLENVKYGIDPIAVKEIFLLPELMPLAQTPPDIVGILNLRGEITPVMHLGLRIGDRFSPCDLTTNVVVLEEDNIKIGVIVDSVQEVMIIDSTNMQTQLDHRAIRGASTGVSAPISSAFITGITKVDEEIIVLLNSKALIRGPDQVKDLVEQSQGEESPEFGELTADTGAESELELDFLDSEESELEESELGDLDSVDFSPSQEEQGGETAPVSASGEETPTANSNLSLVGDFYQRCFPNATAEEKAIFRQRAENLAITAEEQQQKLDEQIPLAVINLEGEYFGLNLELVREFTKVSSLTPIPCCPEHILGNMNLRGEILTLVDICPSLNIDKTTTEIQGSQAVVVEVDEIIAGLTVDEVLDVIYINPQQINESTPIAVDTNADYFQGNTNYQDKFVTILDLAKIMTDDQLVVNDTV